MNDLEFIHGIEIIFITIISKFMLKYKYFIHHYLSMVLFFLFGVTGELIASGFYSNTTLKSWYNILFYLGIFLVENVYLILLKLYKNKIIIHNNIELISINFG